MNNIFMQFAKASQEADVNIDIDVNEAAESTDAPVADLPPVEIPAETNDPVDDEVEEELEDAAEEPAEEPTETAASPEEAVENLETAKEGLESVRDILTDIQAQGVALDDGHVTLARMAIGNSVARCGLTAGAVVPSVESDNYFERTDVDALKHELNDSINNVAVAISQIK